MDPTGDATEDFWRLVPEWVPRDGYATATPALMREVEAGLMRRLSDGD
ncbi:hypothetical protein ACWGBX_02070 [Streptomyces sp. NPDC055037]